MKSLIIRNEKSRIFHFIILVIFLLQVSFVNAQKGTLKGEITDKVTAEAIPYANVSLFKEDKLVAGTSTNSAGIFSIELLPGTYTLIVKNVGYENYTMSGIEIISGKIVIVNIALNMITDVDVLIKDEESGAEEIIITDEVKEYSTAVGREKRDKSRFSVSGCSAALTASYYRAASLAEPVSTAYSTDYSYSKVYPYKNEDTERKTGNLPATSPGVLTAGEVNDFSKWELWKDISGNQLNLYQKYWKFKPAERYTVQLTTDNGKPVIDAEVKLCSAKGLAIWTAHTDNTGKAELWANIYAPEADSTQELTITASYNGVLYNRQPTVKFHDGINIIKIDAECNIPDVLDAMFVVDATSSMGDEISYLKTELNDVIQKVKDKHSGLIINAGSVFYRDLGDSYVTKKSELSSDINNTIDFIKNQYGEGGGDYPEAVDSALNVAIHKIKWSENARARLLFLVLDAPPHYSDNILTKLQKLIASASTKGIRIIPITCSGIDKSTEYLMRAFALATNGTYVFLTDHSGVGTHHIEPTTDKYEVEKLNDLLLRLFFQYIQTPECDQSLKIEEEIQDTMIVTNADTSLLINDTASISSIDTNLSAINDTIRNYSSDSLKNIDTVNNTNIKPLELIRWKYYPNPTSGQLTIEVEGEIGELYLTDLAGKILQRYEMRDRKKIEIQIGEFPAGIYFLRYFISDDKFLDGKVILIHE
ncbi:MAG: carboxypeptidase regulatory-like domain-containing protein [Bacteroidia bacterium]|nr:carboxypeptidase regulatory-like domain-containing protein [Bacteroidia bacterium]